MPLPKEIQSQLDAWKEGKGDFPAALGSGHFFENDDTFLKAAGTRFDGKVRQAAKEARDATLAELAKEFGVDDPSRISELKEKLAASDVTATEAQKLALEVKRLNKELAKATEERTALHGFKVEVLKDRAITPLLSKVAPEFHPLVRKTLAIDLTVDGDKIFGPEAKDAETMLEELIKITPSLKAPEIKPGSGTGPNPPKGKGNGEGKLPNGEKDERTPLQKATAFMMEEHQKRQAGGGQAQ